MLSFVCVNDGEILKDNIFAYLSKTKYSKQWVNYT